MEAFMTVLTGLGAFMGEVRVAIFTGTMIAVWLGFAIFAKLSMVARTDVHSGLLGAILVVLVLDFLN